MSHLEEERLFWDGFAEEYAEIQAESTTTIPQDVHDFLVAENILPTNTFLDLAGGTGKYIPAILANVNDYTLVDFSEKMLQIAQDTHNYPRLQFLHCEQAVFLTQTKDNRYDVVFSAMNPALTSKQILNELLRIANKYVCILRVIEEKDELFSLFEQTPEEWKWMETYKEWLDGKYRTQLFSYNSSESISKEFFLTYFEMDFPYSQLQKIADDLFQQTTEKLNRTTITFELLIIEI